jgi:hypothetical protein
MVDSFHVVRPLLVLLMLTLLSFRQDMPGRAIIGSVALGLSIQEFLLHLGNMSESGSAGPWVASLGAVLIISSSIAEIWRKGNRVTARM